MIRLPVLSARDAIIQIEDDLLYEIGLCLTSVRERPKRSASNNPLLIAIVCSVYAIERIASMFVTDGHYLMYLSDFCHYIDFKIHGNLILLICTLICLSSQLNYYYNYTF